jgi:hypothetical protein
MRLVQTRYLILSVIFVFLINKASSQAILPDSTSLPAERSAISLYSNTLNEQLHLYNGKEYTEYSHAFEEGQPYFISNYLTDGTVTYDGNTYNDVPLLYNVVTDDVIILASNQVSKILLLKERVTAFSLSGHTFRNMPADSLSENMRPGFYDILVAGKTGLVAKRSRLIESSVRQKVEYRITQKDRLYIRKNNGYFAVSNKKTLLEQLGDKRKEIQQYIRKNKLKFRKEAENTMVKTVEYYNQLIK